MAYTTLFFVYLFIFFFIHYPHHEYSNDREKQSNFLETSDKEVIPFDDTKGGEGKHGRMRKTEVGKEEREGRREGGKLGRRKEIEEEMEKRKSERGRERGRGRVKSESGKGKEKGKREREIRMKEEEIRERIRGGE